MDYTNIIKIVGELIGAIIAGTFLYVAPKLKAWLEAKIGKAQSDAVEKLIYNLVESAEQQFYLEDPDGTIRKQYVNDSLVELGYELTNQINAIIYASVYELNSSKND